MSDASVSARDRVEQLERELTHTRQALEDFAYSVSHDLRAPLRHVGAFIKIAREDLGDAIDPQIASHLDTAAAAAAQMAAMMDALLELSRAGRAELRCADIDLARVIADVRDRVQGNCADHQPQWSVASDLPRVYADLAMLGQTFGHLFANALKFTRGCAQPSVDVSWEALAPGMCELHIRDNGVGFDPRFQERLFRVFQRLHSARQFEGMGVGLALARLFVERQGGTIRASGAVGAGCCISLTLPLARAGAA